MIKLPYEYELRMRELLKEDYESYENALQREPERAFRVNISRRV